MTGPNGGETTSEVPARTPDATLTARGDAHVKLSPG
jgi:hypothetical protein